MSKKREWLNPVDSSDNGWIKYGVVQDKDEGYWDAEFRIADCNKVISISLDMYSKKGRQKAIKKLMIIEKAVCYTLNQLIEIDKTDKS